MAAFTEDKIKKLCSQYETPFKALFNISTNKNAIKAESGDINMILSNLYSKVKTVKEINDLKKICFLFSSEILNGIIRDKKQECRVDNPNNEQLQNDIIRILSNMTLIGKFIKKLSKKERKIRIAKGDFTLWEGREYFVTKIQSVFRMYPPRTKYLEHKRFKPGGSGYTQVKNEFESFC